MADFDRPIYGDIWANTGEILSPTTSKITLGWIREMMPYQWQNYLENRQDVALSYLLQKGVPEWDVAQSYVAGKSVVLFGSQLYLALTTDTDIPPPTATHWRQLTLPTGVSGEFLSYNGTNWVSNAVTKATVGLPLVDNTSDVNKPVSTAQSAYVSDLKLYGFSQWQSVGGGWPLNARVVSGGVVYKSSAAANTATPPAAPWVVDNQPTVVSGTGSSTTSVMSQKAVTDQLVGVGQTWQDVTLSRSAGSTYTNSTGRTISVSLSCTLQGDPVSGFFVGAVLVARQSQTSSDFGWSFFITIPVGATYRFEGTSISSWVELR